jgi:hypothetical protein
MDSTSSSWPPALSMATAAATAAAAATADTLAAVLAAGFALVDLTLGLMDLLSDSFCLVLLSMLYNFLRP